MSELVFFGNNLGVECQRCGAFDQTPNGHKYCAQIACPIALREFRRRKRGRTVWPEVKAAAEASSAVAVPVAVPAAARQDDV